MSPLRRALYAAWLYSFSALFCLVMLPSILAPRRVLIVAIARWAQAVRWALRTGMGITVEIRGLEHLPPGPALIAGKHQSMFDFVPPFAITSDPCFVVKKELLDIPLFGWLCRKARMIAVDRGGQAKALKDMLARAREALAEGRQLIIFPEGTRRAPGAAGDYKPGVAALYRELGRPCIPVAINSGVLFNAQGVPRRSGVVVYQILPPIPPGLKRADFMRTLETAIETASNALIDP